MAWRAATASLPMRHSAMRLDFFPYLERLKEQV